MKNVEKTKYSKIWWTFGFNNVLQDFKFMKNVLQKI